MKGLRWQRLVVVSPGLIGGSIARGARTRGLAREVVVVARSEAGARETMAGGGADRVTTDLAEGVGGADLVVLCGPVGVLPHHVRTVWPRLAPGAVLTDAGSVKQAVVAAADACPPRPGVAFVGGHPMAGSERSGFAASDPDLFVNRLTLLTPGPRTPADAIATVTGLWEALGSHVRCLPPDVHDRGVAQISHLPHLVAYGLVAAAEAESLSLAGRGFSDTTRIAASAAPLWTDIFRENRSALLDALGRLEATLSRWRRRVEQGDWAALEMDLAQARALREKLG